MDHHTTPAHVTARPSILYFGTPVVLVSTANSDGSANLAPVSSVFWLGWRAVLGVNAASRTAENLVRTGECVLNLPSDSLVSAVDRLALTTGADPVPERKRQWGYYHVADKFGHAGLTPHPSEGVAPPRVAECPVAMEAVVEETRSLAGDDPIQRGNLLVVETRVTAVKVHPTLLTGPRLDHIDPDAWRPLIMSFQKFYGLGTQLHPSRLSTIPEYRYRTPDFAPTGT
jgi:flavin reductase (DIM6/NTAB) family NADH-FMN oxidoreductase RutF